MVVSYTYRYDESLGDEQETGTPSRNASAKQPEMKTFSFSTVIDLGPVIPREETQVEEG